MASFNYISEGIHSVNDPAFIKGNYIPLLRPFFKNKKALLQK